MRRVIEQAWQDGVRVFIEHGPGSSFARAIRSQLGDREALILSLDRKGLGIDGLLQTAAALIAAGMDIDVDQMLRKAHMAPASAPHKRPLTLPGHWPAVCVPARLDPALHQMMPAPRLPPVSFRPKRPPVPQPSLPHSRPASLARPGHGAPSLARSPAITMSAVEPAVMRHETAQSAIAAMAGQIQALGHMHQTYLRQQTEAHQRFLALRQRAVHGLLHTGTSDHPVRVLATAAAIPESFPAPAEQPPAAAIPLFPRVHPKSAPTPQAISAQREPLGPTFSREQLLVHADGAISSIFGPAFAAQDSFHRQVRMPKPPLLLADRVVGLDAEPMSMGKGTIWTETDVGAEPWYLHHDHMPAGVMIEAGQADLMLISWLGIDPFNRSERVYRLLGCELTYHGNLPKQGETLRFQIELDGHAAQGDVRLMFFHYDCDNGDRKQLSVRKGQAGFFTDQELADSAGCLWTPETQDIRVDARVDAPLVSTLKPRLDRHELQAFADGDLVTAFGTEHGFARTHARTPTIAGGNMLLFDRVTDLSANGGPWGRGYLRAELDIDPTQWFFDGHFKNDPCMPGTLMFEACLAAMAIHLAAMGYTLKRDGWRFQPVPEVPYQLQCRGQVTPTSKLLVTEVFVEERQDGPIPTLFADLLCTVDGLKAFHARRVGLQLVPDWPMSGEATIPAIELTRPVATVDGFRFDRRALLACADGRPSEAFGPMYRRFDGVQRVARLPSPPYHFISRIAEIDGPIGVMKAGARVVAEYDIPATDWYFDTNGNNTMPFAVLLEAALQPCGWLSSYVGSALTQEIELGFRNLDGEGTIFGEIRPGDGTLLTEVRLTDVSASGGMIIENFEVNCRIGDRPIYRLKTVFGFFPEAALAAQAGLPIKAEHREALTRPGERARLLDDRSIGALAPRQATGMLRMIDAIEGFWPDGGKAGLGAARANKQIDQDEWFFKAHFFQDPVQPGSLGLEAMVHTLAYTMIELGMAEGFKTPRLQTIATGFPHRWKYRGQVLPKHKLVQTTLEITERGRDEQGVYALAEASLWLDGQRIYEAIGLGLRIVEEAS
ncbi:MAG: hypothetical protein IPK97_15955 [Ahniella sp.]|nr:hypothetical protein [Ahniella sp.]